MSISCYCGGFSFSTNRERSAVFTCNFVDLGILWGLHSGQESLLKLNFCSIFGLASMYVIGLLIFAPGVWPLRGIRIGEASHPGPAGSMQLYGDEEDLDDLLCGSIEMATRMVELVDEGIRNDTLPPTPFGPTALSPHHPVDVEFVVPPTAIDVEDLSDVVSEEPPVILPPPPVLDQQPSLRRCPFCTGFASRGPVRGLMLHISSRHAGNILNDSARASLTGLDKGMCTNCGALRPF